MKVALLADRMWLNHEASTFRHLVVGLVDEGVWSVPVLPETQADGAVSLMGEPITYRPSVYPLLRDVRLRGLAKPLREAGIDVLHVLDGSLIRAAKLLGSAVGVPTLLHCWSVGEVEAALRSLQTNSAGLTLVLPTAGLLHRVQRSGLSHVPAMHVPSGVVRLEEGPEPLAEPGASVCCVVMTDGRASPALGAMLEGAVAVKNEMPQLQLFLYSIDESTHRLWQAAAKLNALDMVNLVGPEGGARALLVQADAVVCPDALGTARTLLLSAMSAGRPVIAAGDPVIEYLVDGRTAKLVERPTPGQWAEVFRSMAQQPGAMRALGRSAAEYVHEHHGAASFVAHTIEVYREVSGEPIRFGA